SVRALDVGFSPPRGVLLVQCMIGFLALGALRSAWRLVHERYLSRRRHLCQRERKVAIVGAGDVGADLIRELYSRPNVGLVPVAFFDDDRRKWGSEIHGIRVVGPPEQIQRRKEELGLEEAVIAMPSAPARRIGEVVGLLQKARLKHVTVPSVDQLTSGAVRITQLRPVNIEDLLGREAIDLRLNQIGGVLKGHTVLVTGAAGFSPFGIELSPFMVDITQAKLHTRGLAPALVRGRAQALPFPGSIFDSVIMTFPPGFVSDTLVLKELERVLAKGGCVLWVDAPYLFPRDLWSRFLNWALSVSGGQPGRSLPGPAEWQGQLRNWAAAGWSWHVERVERPRSIIHVIVLKPPQ
ncbi:MAG: methyltransferase domain-containing protein, partial [Rudaea sp.]